MGLGRIARLGQKKIPKAYIIASSQFPGDRAALKMKESRGEEDLGLIKALSDAEYQQCEELFNDDYEEIYDPITGQWVLAETDSGTG
jgi:hypothetical protein